MGMAQKQLYSSPAERQKAYRERLVSQRHVEQQRKNLPPLPAVSSIPGVVRWTALIESARVALDTVRDEMQSYADERTERWQESERAELFAERISEIDDVITQIEALKSGSD
jgi:hypothetical protein